MRARIQAEIQRMILDGQRRPGTKLVQQQLARHFGVAQSVIREALLELQVCGLVETAYNRGVFVSRLDGQKLLESFDVREAHECLAVRLCCERTTRAQLRGLAEVAERVYSLGAAGKVKEMSLLDRQFHQDLIRFSGNSMLMRLAENYWVFGKVLSLGREARAVRVEHLAILKAIEAHRAAEAERMVREHIRAAKQALAKQVKAGKFTPQWVL